MTAKQKAWTAGFGVAVANLARDHMEEQLAGFLLGDSGIPQQAFEQSGLDAYDMAVIKKLFETDDYVRRKAAE